LCVSDSTCVLARWNGGSSCLPGEPNGHVRAHI
jgi:hypothetical protein